MSSNKKPHARGKPARLITDEQREQIETLAGLGVKQEDIASVMKIPLITLRRRCAEEMTNGVIKANSNAVKSLYQNVISGNVTAQIYWTKARMGWVDTNRTELVGKDGKDLIPAPVAHINLDKLTSEQIEAQLARTERLILALEGGKGRGGKN